MDNENSAVLYKETLYDKIFKPQVITLANGHSVRRRRSRAPLIVVLLALAIWLSLRMTGFDIAVVIHKFSKMLDLLAKIFQPNWEFFPKVVSPLIDTIKMSVLGTVIGCVCRFIVHFISGITIYKIYEPTELFNSTFTNPYLYSAVYNGSYVFIDMALCLVITALIYKPLKKYINGTDLAR